MLGVIEGQKQETKGVYLLYAGPCEDPDDPPDSCICREVLAAHSKSNF